MRVIHRSAAATAALLLIALPAGATDIAASLLLFTSDAVRVSNTPLIEFDADDWANFLGGGTPEYELPGLGSRIDAFGEPSEFRMPLLADVTDEWQLTQVLERL